MRWLPLTAVLLALSGYAALAEPPQEAPVILIDSMAGSDSFERYCAACHGTSARGDGPVASALRKRPADLTLLLQKNGGTFPRDRVRAFITGTGRQPPAHGTTEMPVWGPMFRMFESDARAAARIDNLVAYLHTIQLPASAK